MTKRRPLPKGKKHFPRISEVFHAFAVEALDPVALTTVNEGGQVSSPALSKWYVQEYCKLNCLTRDHV